MNSSNALLGRLRTHRRLIALACGLLLLTTAVLTSLPPARAQPGGSYAIVWSTIATAVTTTAGPYQLDATIGQPATGTQSGGSYEIGSGFWGGGTSSDPPPPPHTESLFLPLLTRP